MSSVKLSRLAMVLQHYSLCINAYSLMMVLLSKGHISLDAALPCTLSVASIVVVTVVVVVVVGSVSPPLSNSSSDLGRGGGGAK